MPKVFTNAVLPASDLNSFMLQPGTSGTGTRLVAGKTSGTCSAGSSFITTISYGFTFSAAPVVVATARDSGGAGLITDFNADPGTTSTSVRLTARDTGDNLSGVTFVIHWVAVGPA